MTTYLVQAFFKARLADEALGHRRGSPHYGARHAAREGERSWDRPEDAKEEPRRPIRRATRRAGDLGTRAATAARLCERQDAGAEEQAVEEVARGGDRPRARAAGRRHVLKDKRALRTRTVDRPSRAVWLLCLFVCCCCSSKQGPSSLKTSKTSRKPEDGCGLLKGGSRGSAARDGRRGGGGQPAGTRRVDASNANARTRRA